MSSNIHLLAPSLIPNSILSLTVPSNASSSFVSSARTAKRVGIEENQARSRGFEERCEVKQYDFVTPPEGKEVGVVQRLARQSSGEKGKNSNTYAVADSNHCISTFTFSSHRRSATDEDDSDDEEDMAESKPSTEADEDEDDRDIEVKSQFKVKAGRKADQWVGLEMTQHGIISTLSSGLLSYHSLDPSATVQQAHLPSPLTCFQTVPKFSGETGPSQFIAAGKNVELSLWDLEKTLAAGETAGAEGAAQRGQKRKKNELDAGEIWRARNLPNNYLNLPVPVHHLSACVLPSSGADSIQIATGTKSGHVRRYDTRDRKVVANWKTAKEGGGIKLVEAGKNEHELFFADTINMLGSLDLRTGKVLYVYPQQTCTAQYVLPLPSHGDSLSRDGVGMVSLSSDATIRLHSVTPPAKEAKGNVVKGTILGGIPGIGLGNVVLTGYSDVEHADDESEGEGEGEEGERNVWDDMSVVDDEGSDEESELDEEEEAMKKKRKMQTKPKPRE